MNGFINTIRLLGDIFESVVPSGVGATLAVVVTLLVALALWRHVSG